MRPGVVLQKQRRVGRSWVDLVLVMHLRYMRMCAAVTTDDGLGMSGGLLYSLEPENVGSQVLFVHGRSHAFRTVTLQRATDGRLDCRQHCHGSHLVRPSGTAHNDSEGTCNSDVCINYLECGLCSAFRTPTGSAATGLGFCWAIFSIRTIDNTANNNPFAFAPTQLFVEQSGRFAESQSSDFDRYVAGPFGAVDTTLSSRQYLRYSTDALIAAIVRCDGAMRSTEDFTLAYDNPGGVSVRAVKATATSAFFGKILETARSSRTLGLVSRSPEQPICSVG